MQVPPTRRFRLSHHRWPSLLLAMAAAMQVHSTHAAESLLGGGVGARAMGMGGTEVATPGSGLGALAINPAGLSLLSAPEADAGFEGASAYGDFHSRNGSGGTLATGMDFGPEGAIAVPVPSTPFTVGVGVIPQMGLSARWNFPDPPGGLGGTTSYGYQRDNSEIEVVRVALGASAAITRQLSIGGGLGLNYNENLLQTPYIFQSQPVLRGFKTLLNLATSGWGANGMAGILYKVSDTVSLGLSYQSETTIKTRGFAEADAGAQLKALGPGFASVGRDLNYNAEVDNTFPQIVSGGIAWKFKPGWEASAELDWTGWSGAFNSLPVRLSRGTNAQVNALVGSNSLVDNIPLGWKDSFTYRFGIEDAVTRNLFLRAGYAYMTSTVPTETLTPLTAAIPENMVSLGAGYRWRWLQVDLAYQWEIPISRHVGNSELLDGEYSDSNVRVGVQWIALTTTIRF